MYYSKNLVLALQFIAIIILGLKHDALADSLSLSEESLSLSGDYGERELMCGEKTIQVHANGNGSTAQQSTDNCMQGLDTQCGNTVTNKKIKAGPKRVQPPGSGFYTECEGDCTVTWCLEEQSSDSYSKIEKLDPVLQSF